MNEKIAVVLGGAQSVWRDFARLERMIGRAWPGVVAATNETGCEWTRRLDYWVSLHPIKWWNPNGWRNPDGGPHGWTALRELRGYPKARTLVAHTSKRKGVPDDIHVVQQWGGGSSGLLAVASLYETPARIIVLCGVPMDERPHLDESVVHKRDRGWASFKTHRRVWERSAIQERLRDRTYSMSGWTRMLLGEPDPEEIRALLE